MPPRKKKEPAKEPAQTAEAIQVEAEPVEPGAVIISQADLQAVQQEYQLLDSEVQRLGQENLIMAKALKKMKEDHFPDPQPWYASWGVWLAIFLTLGAMYLAFAFYMSETGHHVVIPRWFIDWLDTIIPH